MSGLVGKGIRSYKKANVSDSNNPALGFRNFIMAFEVSSAVGAEIALELANDAMPLTPPAEMVTAGFQAPSNIEIINAQLGTFRNNVTVTSNLNGILIDRVSYTLTDTTITFDDGLNAGEIIVIKRGNEVVNGNRIVDARPLRASGTVDFSTIGSAPVIFEVGEGFRIAPSTTATGGIDNRQIGFVQVFADGVLQARNVGNEDESMLPASEQTGNYREVIVDGLGVLLATQNGVTANAIEFNQFQPFSAEEGVIVISTNLIVDSPNSTGVIDQVGALGARVTAVETDVTANTASIVTNTSNIATNTAAIANFSGGGGLLAIQEFTASGTYTIPDDAVALRITAAGAGGGGGGIGPVFNTSSNSGNGGASGEYGTAIVNLGGTGTSRTATITVAGAASGNAQASGTTGDNTTILFNGVTTTWLGGTGGAGGPANAHPGVTGTVPPNSGQGFSAGGGGFSFVTTLFTGSTGNVVPASIGIVNGNFSSNAAGRYGAGGGDGGRNGKAAGGFGSAGAIASGNGLGGGGGGGGGWLPGSNGSTQGGQSTGGNGGRGGMIIEALSILPT